MSNHPHEDDVVEVPEHPKPTLDMEDVDLDEMARQYRKNEDREHALNGELAGHSSPCPGSTGVCTPEDAPSSPEPPTTPEDEIVEPRRKKLKTGPTPASVLMDELGHKDTVISAADLTAEQREHMSLHNRARTVLPQEQITGRNRFWIAVLNPEVKVANVRRETDLIWMKGHGVSQVLKLTIHLTDINMQGTTIMTVWQVWRRQSAADPEFKLQINNEFPSNTTVMRELDFYNDRMTVKFNLIPKS